MEWLRKITKIIRLVILWAKFELAGSCIESRNTTPWTSMSPVKCVVHKVVSALTQCSSLTGARNRVHSHSPLMWLYSWRCRHYVHPKPLYQPTRLQHGAILRNNNSVYYSRIRKWILSVPLSASPSICLSVCLSVDLSVTLFTWFTSDTVQRIFFKFWYWNVSSKLNKQSSAHLQVRGSICINSLRGSVEFYDSVTSE